MSFNFGYGAGFFGILLSLAFMVIPFIVYYFVIRTAINHSDVKLDIDALRKDLNLLEHRQADRFQALDQHFQEQNKLLREQNEMMLRAERDRSSNQE
ncbi:hypothetical protein [Saccharibacillus sp. JS10]|uniref:hypothetical protein n=1 Tax=Saccharibacillus sp. JS10 TaxID=2950552 RepID=UPI00210E7161|nr:hypothetical protein [Saccharibacillus sp. JS10]MCQ4088639.1 hypothetical protein [Saccharibacillus sp. JS10]